MDPLVETGLMTSGYRADMVYGHLIQVMYDIPDGEKPTFSRGLFFRN